MTENKAKHKKVQLSFLCFAKLKIYIFSFKTEKNKNKFCIENKTTGGSHVSLNASNPVTSASKSYL